MFFINNCFASEIDNFQFMSEEFPPYNYIEDNQPKGSSVETFNLLLKKLKAKKNISSLTFWPWARSYTALQSKTNHLLFVVTKTKARENLFKWVGPISKSSNVLIGKKFFEIKTNPKSHLANYRYCVVREDAGGQLLKQNYQIPSNMIYEATDPLTCIHLIKNNRADLIAYDENVTHWLMKKNRESIGDYSSKMIISESEHYIAFSKDTSDQIIKKFQDAIDEIKKEKEFQLIKQKYFKK
jgi:ABC-type amino acid transport substrate-binding protein